MEVMNKIILLILFTLSSCEPVYYYEYVVKNETGRSVKIEGFDRINTSYDIEMDDVETIYIEANSFYSISKQMGYHAEFPGIFQSVQIDSVNIMFDNEKQIVQSCNQPELRICLDEVYRNIMNFESGDYVIEKTGRSSGKIEYRYTYTLTEEDYERAVFIDSLENR